MGCGASSIVPKTEPRLKCPRHPKHDVKFFDKNNHTIICDLCPKASNINQVVNLVTFINSMEFNKIVDQTDFALTKDIKSVINHEQNLTREQNGIKQRVNGFIEDIIKLLGQLKSDLYCDADKAVRDHREKLQKRFDELESFNKTLRAFRANKSYESKVSLIRSCYEYKHSTSIDANMKYEVENNSVIQDWQEKHKVFLQPPYPESEPSGVSSIQRKSSAESADSEYASESSGYLRNESESQVTGAKRRSKGHTDDFQTDKETTKPGNISRSDDGRMSTARLSKIGFSDKFQCVKTLHFQEQTITCSVETEDGCVILCDLRNSEVLLLDRKFRPLRSTHLSGRYKAVESESMQTEDLAEVKFRRLSFRGSKNRYGTIDMPRFVAVDGEDNIYVVEDESAHVHMISGNGIYEGFVLTMDTPIVHFNYLPTHKAFLVVTEDGMRIDLYTF